MSASLTDKIAKLLAKANGTDNEHEAAIFNAKAQQLMVENAISEAMLEMRHGARNEIIRGSYFPCKDVGEGRDGKVALLRKIASTFGCSAFNVVGDEQVSVYGYPSDIVRVVTLWFSLCLQGDKFCFEAIKAEKVSNILSFEKSFFDEYAWRVGDRVREKYQQTVNEANEPDLLPVLRDRKREVEAFVDTQFEPVYTSNKVGRPRSSAQGMRAGGAAGERANISGGYKNFSGGRRQLGK